MSAVAATVGVARTATSRRVLPPLVIAALAGWFVGCYLTLSRAIWLPSAQVHQDAWYLLGGTGLAAVGACAANRRSWLPLGACSLGTLALLVPVDHWHGRFAALALLGWLITFEAVLTGWISTLDTRDSARAAHDDGGIVASLSSGLFAVLITLLAGAVSFGTVSTVFAWRSQRRRALRTVETSTELDTSMSTEPHQTLDELLAELDAMVGLEPAKREVRNLVDFIQLTQERQRRGLSAEPITLHLALTGPSGGGKTSLARIIAGIYFVLGLLPSARVEVRQAGSLTAGYVRQTSDRANAVIDEALPGVLVLDEIGALIPKGENDFAREAIKVLLDRTENDRHQLVVILTGYPDEITAFLAADAGLPSRFPRLIDCPGGDPDDLAEITRRMCEKETYTLDQTAYAELRAEFARRGPDGGNGRLARNLFEAAKLAQSSRLRGHDARKLSDRDLSMLTGEDVRVAAGRVGEQARSRA